MKSTTSALKLRSYRKDLMLHLLIGVGLAGLLMSTVVITEIIRLDLPWAFGSARQVFASIPPTMKFLGPMVATIFVFSIWRLTRNRELAHAKYTELLRSYSRQLEAKNASLTSLNTVMDRLVYTTSHELKTPVVNFVGLLRMLEMIRKRPEMESEVDNVLSKLQISADRMTEVIDDLLQVASLERGDHEPVADLDLKASVETVVDSLDNLVQDRHARIRVETAEAPSLRFGAQGLESILHNLLSNALQYSAVDREVEILVQSRPTATGVEIMVSDNGIGMDLSAYRDKIFSMFTKMHNHSGGSGIGLYIVKKLVERGHGTIEVESAVGKGTTFRMHFPQEPAANAPVLETVAGGALEQQ